MDSIFFVVTVTLMIVVFAIDTVQKRRQLLAKNSSGRGAFNDPPDPHSRNKR